MPLKCLYGFSPRRNGLIIPQKQYRCRYCGHLLPAWLPVAKRPESSMLLHHLGDLHPEQAGPYLRRMEREPIDAVLMEVYELVDIPPGGVDQN
jgi:hypothetical protein